MTSRCDAVILDTDLPDGRGTRLIRDLWFALGKNVPIFVFSASDTSQDVRASLEAGCTAFVSKRNCGRRHLTEMLEDALASMSGASERDIPPVSARTP
jgi:DNA-binding NarL/FixJ family response regulator